MRGISIIIVMVLLTIIVISLVGLLYTFSSKLFATTTSTAQESLNETTKNLLANMIIIDVEGNKIIVRNAGQTELSNFEVFIGNTPIKFDIDKLVLQPGAIAVIKMAKSPDTLTVPAGDISVITSEFSFGSKYKDYQGYSTDSSTAIVNQQSLVNFTTPLNGYRVTATVYDEDSLNEITYCSLSHERTDMEDWFNNYWTYYSFAYYENGTYDPTTGNCTADITTFDINPNIWYKTEAAEFWYPYSEHSLILDVDYVYSVDYSSTVYKYSAVDGSLAGYQTVGSGASPRGMSSDSEFLYFGDSTFTLYKLNKTDLTTNSSRDYGTATIYSTAVDDTGVYFGNSVYNITKVNKTNFTQKLWSVDYGSGTVYDMDVDDEYLYTADVRNITKINKTSVGTAQKIWSIRPLNLLTYKYSLVLDGNYLWVGDAQSRLWQIDKSDGSFSYTNYSDFISGGIMEITYDDNFIFLSSGSSQVIKVNKVTKAVEDIFYFYGTPYGLACNANYCYSSDSGGFVTKFFREIPASNYNSGESITSQIWFYDIYGNATYTSEATNVIP